MQRDCGCCALLKASELGTAAAGSGERSPQSITSECGVTRALPSRPRADFTRGTRRHVDFVAAKTLDDKVEIRVVKNAYDS